MLRRRWTKQIRQIIQTHSRIAIVGVGHELCSDDTVAVKIVQTLQKTVPQNESVLLCVAGSAPENFTGVIRCFEPDIILLIDAVHMDAPPGAVRLLGLCDVENYLFSTHTLPLTLFVQYLKSELHCAVALLGIQPLDLSLGTSLSPPVNSSKTRIIRTIKASLLSAPVPIFENSS